MSSQKTTTWCILVPTIPERISNLEHLVSRIKPYLDKELNGVVIKLNILCTDSHKKGGLNIGDKRNLMIKTALENNYDYISFVDDDDILLNGYFELITEIISYSKPDVIGFKGIYTHNKRNTKKFVIDVNCKGWYEENNIYYRYPNHLSPIKTSIAAQIGFQSLTSAEDRDYSFRLMISKLIKTSAFIDSELYHYDYMDK